MRIRQTLTLLAAAVGLAAIVTPAMASGNTAPTHPTHPAHPAHPTTSGSSTTLPSQAKAYGRYCQTESKTHVAGTPGTPFSTCVKDMAKAAKAAKAGTTPAPNPRRVCLNESKTHVAHMKGTPYSQCVSGAERLLKDMAKTTS